MSKQQQQARRLVTHDDLPAWSVDNEFIVNGYRAPGGINDEIRARNSNDRKRDSKAGNTTTRRKKAITEVPASDTEYAEYYEHNSFYRCWMSMWLYLHNETVNIHSHFWGALVALLLMGLHLLSAFGIQFSSLHFITHHSIFYSEALTPSKLATNNETSWLSMFSAKTTPVVPLPIRIGSIVTAPAMKVAPWLLAHQRPNDWKDVVGFTSFLCGAVTVLTFSTTFHTMICHSREVAYTCNQLDYIGIVAMIVGSFIPMLHYGFYCHPHLQLFYSLLILALGSLAIYTVLARKFATPAYRPIRACVFLALGLSAIFPVAHILAMYGYEAVALTMGIQHLVAGGALYIIGACLYMARIPERFSPGTFDNFGASHQIFHFLILFAAASHYICIRRSYSFWHTVEAIDGNAICYAFESLRHSV